MTGEPDAVAATLEATSPEPLSCQTLLFASSLVVSGEGLALVTRTGTNTMIASIASLASGTSAPQITLLQRELKRVVRLMVIAAVVVACAFLAIGLGRGEPVVSVIVNGADAACFSDTDATRVPASS
jgi:Ca2+-transporting ATPase